MRKNVWDVQSKMVRPSRIQPSRWKSPVILPLDYDPEIVKAAVEFLGDEEEKWRQGQKKLSLETDGLEIVAEGNENELDDEEILTRDTIYVSQGAFVVPKEEQESE
jgi:hypothetical protein